MKIKKVNLYVDSKYNPTDDCGSYGFYIKCGNYKVIHGQTYNKTSGARMEMIACLEAVNMIGRKYGRETIVSIHSKQVELINSLRRGGTKDSNSNPNQDLYDRSREMRQVSVIVVERKDLDLKEIFVATRQCEFSFNEEAILIDKKDKPKGTPLF